MNIIAIKLLVDFPTSLPTFKDLTEKFGPYLGLLIFFLFLILYLQWYWFNRTLKGKDEEIKRSVSRVSELEKLVNKMMNQEIANKNNKRK